MILNSPLRHSLSIGNGKLEKKQAPTLRRTAIAPGLSLDTGHFLALTKEKRRNAATAVRPKDSPAVRPAVERDVRLTDTKSPLVSQKKTLVTADEFTGKDARVAKIPVQTSFQPMKTVAEKISNKETQPEEIQPENLSVEQNSEALSENPERTPEARPKMNVTLIIAGIAAAGIAASYFILKK